MTGTVDTITSARGAGFRMPAEWAPHDRCWMQWPDKEDFIWPDLHATQRAYAEVALAVARFEPVTLVVNRVSLASAQRLCGSAVDYLVTDIDDAWARDSGPNFVVKDGELAASIFHFNAWGQKYELYRNDAALGHRIAEYLGIRTFTANIFMEGGGINVDGEGTVLTSERCILNDNRNPRITREDAESVLCEALGAERVIWLPGDPQDEETDGHVDGVACFVEPGAVLCSVAAEGDKGRERIADANRAALLASTDANGRQLQVIDLPEAASARAWGERFSRSYINFYIANGGIVFPRYGIAEDDVAAGIVTDCFPGREIVAVDITPIAGGGGGIHCITQQQPSLTLVTVTPV